MCSAVWLTYETNEKKNLDVVSLRNEMGKKSWRLLHTFYIAKWTTGSNYYVQLKFVERKTTHFVSIVATFGIVNWNLSGISMILQITIG